MHLKSRFGLEGSLGGEEEEANITADFSDSKSVLKKLGLFEWSSIEAEIL